MIRKPLQTGMRAVAVVEGAKAAIVLLFGFGLLSLVHHDVQRAAERIVRSLHLDPVSKFPSIFLKWAGHVTDAQLLLGASLAVLYVLVRSVEAYGLWYERRWAEWFALVSCGVYLPYEIYHMWHHFGWIKAGIYLTNLTVFLYMAYALRHTKEQDRELGKIP